MKRNEFSLGLDIGIASIGWALIDKKGKRIVDKAVRTFPTASPAVERREKRSSRRTTDRKKKRIQEVRQLLTANGFPSTKEQGNLVWEWRVDALDRLLADEEFRHVLLQLTKRRGYQSNRRDESLDQEGKVTLEAIHENVRLMEEKGYRTIGEMIGKDPKFQNQKRNRKNNYSTSVYRSDLENEIRLLFASQRAFGNAKASEELEEAFLQIWSRQLPYSTIELLEGLVGDCEFEPNEKRAPQATYTFQYFRLLQNLNNLRLMGEDVYRPLTEEERTALLATCMKRKKTSYYQLRGDLEKLGSAPLGFRFAGIQYAHDQPNKTNEKNEFVSMERYYDMAKLTKGKYSPDDFDAFGYAITYTKTDEQFKAYMCNTYRHHSTGELLLNPTRTVYEEDVIQEINQLRSTGFSSLSMVAMKKLIPYLENGLSLAEAIELAGYKKESKREKPNLLPPLAPIGNYAVNRAMTQARKLVNSIIKTYGVPERIVVEFARDLKMNDLERSAAIKSNQKNRDRNREVVNAIIKEGIRKEVKPHDIVKYKLWKEQAGLCVYSGEPISLKQVFNDHVEVEIDHIIPQSRSLDDSYDNKVLVKVRENQNKGNRIPAEYMNVGQWEGLQNRLSTVFKNFSNKKKELLSRRSFTKAESEAWRSRHLNDTSYIAKAFQKELMEHVDTRVSATNGRITGILRKNWQLTKVREHSDIHHAMDAAVIAVTDTWMIEQMTKYHKTLGDPRVKKKPRFPQPWIGFADDLVKSLDNTVVSRMPIRKVSADLHKETIYSLLGIGENGKYQLSKKTHLRDIPFDDNGDFPLAAKETEKHLYAKIKGRYLEDRQRLADYNRLTKDEKKLLEAPELFDRPLECGGEVVRRVSLLSEAPQVREVKKGGYAIVKTVYRVDLFEKEGRMYMVPMYPMDLPKKTLPTKFSVIKKGYEQWGEIDDAFEFVLSLQKSDLVEVQFLKERKISLKSGEEKTINKDEKVLMYLKGIKPNNNILLFDLMDNSNLIDVSISIQSKPVLMTKMEVDMMGRMAKVKKGKRPGL